MAVRRTSGRRGAEGGGGYDIVPAIREVPRISRSRHSPFSKMADLVSPLDRPYVRLQRLFGYLDPPKAVDRR